MSAQKELETLQARILQISDSQTNESLQALTNSTCWQRDYFETNQECLLEQINLVELSHAASGQHQGVDPVANVGEIMPDIHHIATEH